MQQCGHENKDVPRTVKHPRSIGHKFQMVVKPVHVLASEKKNDQHDQPKEQMESFHAVK
jgi:hypothetical protein